MDRELTLPKYLTQEEYEKMRGILEARCSSIRGEIMGLERIPRINNSLAESGSEIAIEMEKDLSDIVTQAGEGSRRTLNPAQVSSYAPSTSNTTHHALQTAVDPCKHAQEATTHRYQLNEVAESHKTALSCDVDCIYPNTSSRNNSACRISRPNLDILGSQSTGKPNFEGSNFEGPNTMNDESKHAHAQGSVTRQGLGYYSARELQPDGSFAFPIGNQLAPSGTTTSGNHEITPQAAQLTQGSAAQQVAVKKTYCKRSRSFTPISSSSPSSDMEGSDEDSGPAPHSDNSSNGEVITLLSSTRTKKTARRKLTALNTIRARAEQRRKENRPKATTSPLPKKRKLVREEGGSGSVRTGLTAKDQNREDNLGEEEVAEGETEETNQGDGGDCTGVNNSMQDANTCDEPTRDGDVVEVIVNSKRQVKKLIFL